MLERIDFVFSYWIVFWYICYELRITKYNPIVALYLGLFVNIVILLLMIYYKNSYYHLLLYCFLLLVLKIIPLWRLRNTSYSMKDIYIIFIYYLVYILWMFFNHVNIISYNNAQLKNIKNDKPWGPFMIYVEKIMNR